jgi:YspA, cpYpsA-related SLOG family
MADSGYRVLVAGSRAWEDGYTIFRVLNEILNEQGTPLTVILGNTAKGAGHITRMWCQVHPGGMIGMESLPGVAGKELAERFTPHLVVAFLMPCDREWCPQYRIHWDHGPDQAVQYARAKGIKVRTLEAVPL